VKPRKVHLFHPLGGTACSVVRPFRGGRGTTARGLVTCLRCLEVIARIDREDDERSEHAGEDLELARQMRTQ
jgi:hypothetical protein